MARLKDFYKDEIVAAMTKKFGYKNVMAQRALLSFLPPHEWSCQRKAVYRLYSYRKATEASQNECCRRRGS